MPIDIAARFAANFEAAMARLEAESAAAAPEPLPKPAIAPEASMEFIDAAGEVHQVDATGTADQLGLVDQFDDLLGIEPCDPLDSGLSDSGFPGEEQPGIETLGYDDPTLESDLPPAPADQVAAPEAVVSQDGALDDVALMTAQLDAVGQLQTPVAPAKPAEPVAPTEAEVAISRSLADVGLTKAVAHLLDEIIRKAVYEKQNPMGLIIKVISGWGQDNIERISRLPVTVMDPTSVRCLIELGEHNRPAYGLIKSLESATALAADGKDINEPLETTLATIDWLMGINAEVAKQANGKG